jgi:uncharacterized protein YecT (DUF1311 family)
VIRLAALAAVVAGLAAAGPAQAWCEAESSMVETKDCLARVERETANELDLVLAEAQRDVAARDFLDPLLRARFAVALDRAQAAWSAWRDVECGEVVPYEWWGGSGAGAAARSCAIDMTAGRARDLVARYRLDPALIPVSAAGAGK